MNRDTKPAQKGTAADASDLRPLPLLPGRAARYHSRGVGYFRAVVCEVHEDGTVDLEVTYPVASTALLIKNAAVHRGVETCPKGDCIL